MLHDEMRLGVVDFNLTNDYIYIDYVFPANHVTNNEDNTELTKYNWAQPTKNIQSLNLVTVRLKKDFIDFVYQKHRGQLHTLKYLGDYDQICRDLLD